MPKDLEKMQDEVDMALSGEKESFQSIYRIKRLDGEVTSIKADGAVQSYDNVIISFIGTKQYITDFKN